MHHGKEPPFVIKVMVKATIVMVKFFVKVPSLVCVGDAHQPYQICLSAPSDEGVRRGFIQTDTVINNGNPGGPLLDGKGRALGMNTAIVTTSGSNTGIGFAVPVDRYKPAVEDIASADLLLRRGKGANVESGNGGRPSPGWMGMDLVDKRAGIRKSHTEISEV